MNARDEQILVEQARTSQQAFGRLFDAYYPPVVNYVLRRVGDVTAAEDITSIVFFKVWHALPKYERRDVPFGAWVYRIAGNEVNSHFRRQKNRPASLEALFEATGFEMPDALDIAHDYEVYEDALARHQDFLLVQQLILQLPVRYQEVLALRYFERKSIQAIARITNKKEGTVKSLLSRGTAKLVRAFQSHKRLHP